MKRLLFLLLLCSFRLSAQNEYDTNKQKTGHWVEHQKEPTYYGKYQALELEGNYKAGLREGKWSVTTYNPGYLDTRCSGEYRDGKRQGPWLFYTLSDVGTEKHVGGETILYYRDDLVYRRDIFQGRATLPGDRYPAIPSMSNTLNLRCDSLTVTDYINGMHSNGQNRSVSVFTNFPVDSASSMLNGGWSKFPPCALMKEETKYSAANKISYKLVEDHRNNYSIQEIYAKNGSLWSKVITTGVLLRPGLLQLDSAHLGDSLKIEVYIFREGKLQRFSRDSITALHISSYKYDSLGRVTEHSEQAYSSWSSTLTEDTFYTNNKISNYFHHSERLAGTHFLRQSWTYDAQHRLSHYNEDSGANSQEIEYYPNGNKKAVYSVNKEQVTEEHYSKNGKRVNPPKRPRT